MQLMQPKTPQKVHSLPAELTELETFCRETFGVRATITGNQKKGKTFHQVRLIRRRNSCAGQS